MATNVAGPFFRGGLAEPSTAPPAPQGPQVVPTPPGKSPERGPGPWVLLLGVALGAGLYWWSHVAPQPSTTASPAASIPTVAASEQPFVESIRLTGTVAARDAAMIRAPQLRVRSQLTLTELAPAGSMVKAGDIVARFESRDLEDRLDDARSKVIQAQAALEKERASIIIERETLRQERDAATAERDKALFDLRKAEVLSQIQAELLRNSAAEAEAAWQQLEREAALQEEAFKRRLRVEEINIAEATLAHERLERDLVQATVRAPMAGLVVLESMMKGGGQFQQVAVGDQIYPGAAILQIVDLSELMISASMNQVDSQDVRLGQPAKIRFDAYPDLVVDGKVASVAAIASAGQAGFGAMGGGMQVKSIPVQIAFEAQDPRILPDLSVAVDVTLREEGAALVVPRAAVERRRDGGAYVRAREGAAWTEREVQVGASNGVETVILAGLEPGTLVAAQFADLR